MTNYTPSKLQFYVMFTTIYFHNFIIIIYKYNIDNTELLLLVVLIILIKAVDCTMQ